MSRILAGCGPDRCSTEESYELAPSHAEHSFLLGAGATCRGCRLATEPLQAVSLRFNKAADRPLERLDLS
jgi:hypothetical protein